MLGTGSSKNTKLNTSKFPEKKIRISTAILEHANCYCYLNHTLKYGFLFIYFEGFRCDEYPLSFLTIKFETHTVYNTKHTLTHIRMFMPPSNIFLFFRFYVFYALHLRRLFLLPFHLEPSISLQNLHQTNGKQATSPSVTIVNGRRQRTSTMQRRG